MANPKLLILEEMNQPSSPGLDTVFGDMIRAATTADSHRSHRCVAKHVVDTSVLRIVRDLAQLDNSRVEPLRSTLR